MKYLVTSPGEREITVNAKDSAQAKRLACKYWGIKPGDPWCGITAMKAKKLEMKGWEEHAARRERIPAQAIICKGGLT